MIYLTAINDVSETSKFQKSIVKTEEANGRRLWGLTELTTSTFDRIKKGDYILYYHKGEIIGYSKILQTFIDEELARKLWGTYSHRLKGVLLWSKIIELENFKKSSVNFSFIIKLGDYSEKFSVRRLISLNDTATKRIVEQFGDESNFIKKHFK